MREPPSGGSRRFWAEVKAIAYVDGYNLYFRALRETDFKWLDISKVLRAAYPGDDFAAIHYFTAYIRGRSAEDRKPLRQKAYLTALRTVPGVQLHFGQYQRYKEMRRVVTPVPGQPTYVEVWDDVEKQSDVNLATALLMDAFDRACEKAVVVSNDSDLLTPIAVARTRFGIHVAVFSPDREKPNLALKAAASSFKEIQVGTLAESQLPDTLATPTGTISRPDEWKPKEKTWRDKLAEFNAGPEQK